MSDSQDKKYSIFMHIWCHLWLNLSFDTNINHPSIAYQQPFSRYKTASFNRRLLGVFSHFPPPWRFLNQKALSWGDDFRWFHLGTNFFPVHQNLDEYPQTIGRTLCNLSDKNESISPKYLPHILLRLSLSKNHQMLSTNLEKLLSLLTTDLHQMLCKCHELLKWVAVHMNHQV